MRNITRREIENFFYPGGLKKLEKMEKGLKEISIIPYKERKRNRKELISECEMLTNLFRCIQDFRDNFTGKEIYSSGLICLGAKCSVTKILTAIFKAERELYSFLDGMNITEFTETKRKRKV